jgi:hypothetical protein
MQTRSEFPSQALRCMAFAGIHTSASGPYFHIRCAERIMREKNQGVIGRSPQLGIKFTFTLTAQNPLARQKALVPSLTSSTRGNAGAERARPRQGRRQGGRCDPATGNSGRQRAWRKFLDRPNPSRRPLPNGCPRRGGAAQPHGKKAGKFSLLCISPSP